MGPKSAGVTEFCPESANPSQRRKRLPENHSSARRRHNRARGSVKRYPSHWSDQQKRARADLRKWERLPFIAERDKFPVKLFASQRQEGRLQPYILPAFYALGAQLALVLGCVAKAVLHQRAAAVSGSREAWAQLLGCGGTKAYEYLRDACKEGLLERLPQFKPHSGRGRDGERIDNRQIDTCYRPGLRLKSMWLAYHNELEQRRKVRTFGPRSTADASHLPSLRSKSFTSSLQAGCDPASNRLGDKVSPLATNSLPPPTAAHLTLFPAVLQGLPRITDALAAVHAVPTIQAGRPSQSASRADSSRTRYSARPERPILDDEKRVLDEGALDTAHARALWRLAHPDNRPAHIPRGDTECLELALTLARLTAMHKGGGVP